MCIYSKIFTALERLFVFKLDVEQKQVLLRVRQIVRSDVDNTCPSALRCLSLWYKILDSHEKGPDREAGGGSVAGGCGARLPAGSQCPELARHVDRELVPDLKLPPQPEGKA